MIGIVTKIRAKIANIVVENREPYRFIILFKCKRVPFPCFLIRRWLQLLTTDERSTYYKVYEYRTRNLPFELRTIFLQIRIIP